MFSAALYAHARTSSTIAHETSGAACIRHSLRPLITRGRENNLQTSGAMGREKAFRCHRPPPGRPNGRPMTGSGGRSSIPKTLMIEPRSRGVLDTRTRGYDDIFAAADCHPVDLKTP